MIADTAPTRAPKVSLCIPAYQAERHLQATIDSVLAQSYGDFEVVVVDNNSSDGTSDIVAALRDDRVRVIRNATTLPIAENFNWAVRQSRGQYVKLICADDTLEPDCIAAQVAGQTPTRVWFWCRRERISSTIPVMCSARQGAAGNRRTAVGSVDGQARRPQWHQSDRASGGGHVPARRLRPVRRLPRRIAIPDGAGPVGSADRHGDFFGVPKTLASFRIGAGSMTALTSARSQLDQQLEFARRLVDDPRWRISTVDRLVGVVNIFDKQLRRNVLFFDELRSRSPSPSGPPWGHSA